MRLKGDWRSLFPGLSVICLLVPSARSATSGEPPAAYHNAAELRSQLHNAQGLLQAIWVIYHSDHYASPRFPPGTYLRRSIAAKAPCLLYHELRHGVEGEMEWPDDPRAKRHYVTADSVYMLFPARRKYKTAPLKPDAPLPGELQYLFFFVATGLWPLDERPAPVIDGSPCALRDVAASEKYSIVRPRQELVDGRWCHVLEHEGMDRLWIDVERGCCLLAREICAANGGEPARRFELGGHREVSAGIWLPTWIKIIRYIRQGEQNPEEDVSESRMTIDDVKVNHQVDESIFNPHLPPGSVIVTDEGWSQTIPGGLDLLDEMSQWIQRFWRPAPMKSSSRKDYLALVPAALIIAICEARIRRRQRAADRAAATSPDRSPPAFEGV